MVLESVSRGGFICGEGGKAGVGKGSNGVCKCGYFSNLVR